MKTSRWFAPTPERTQAVIKDVTDGSEPKSSYYALLVTAAMIACFGLVTNSTAVIIGAMLVSPLMTPIFGIAMAMLRGEVTLLGRALRAEFGGVALAVAASFFFGLFPLNNAATPEMLARTHPHLLDLLVAVFAGFAGAYALLDERVSPALPGVAIATAIVPPLSTCGLCLASGAYEGAFGAFLLFLANFIAILMVALIMFTIAGMAPTIKWNSFRDFSRRFAPTVIGFVLISVVLTNSLIRITHERTTNETIHNVLRKELARDSVALDDFQQKSKNGTLYVLATVRSPKPIRPHRITKMQEALVDRLGRPARLVVRTMIAEDVAAAGSKVKAGETNLNGVFFSTELSPRESKTRVARQVFLEELNADAGFRLEDLKYGQSEKGSVVFAVINTIRPIYTSEVHALERVLQDRLDDPHLALVIQYAASTLVESNGPMLIEWTSYGGESVRNSPATMELRQLIHEEVQKLPNVFPMGVHFRFEEEKWRALVEVVGPRPVTPEEVSHVQEAIAAAAPRPLDISIWYKADTVVTPDGYGTREEFTGESLRERIESLPDLFADTRSP